MAKLSLDFIDYPQSELVIGIVAPTGTNIGYLENELEERLKLFGYFPVNIRLSSLLKIIEHGVEIKEDNNFDRINTLMSAGSETRKKARRGDALALLAIGEIAKLRGENREPKPKTAYILHSLKHPHEVIALQRIYKEGFFLFGIFSPEDERLSYLINDRGISSDNADKLINRDQNEDLPSGLGQRTRDTFHLADAFISLEDLNEAKEQLKRILNLIFGNPFITPTSDENAMYMAYASSFRSGDLSRQVGAVVTSKENEVIAVGMNDVPCFGGGLYHSEKENDARDFKRGFDSNAERKKEILNQVTDFIKEKFVPRSDYEIKGDDDLFRAVKDGLAKSLLSGITEFGRPVHAEMEALLSCARKSISPQGGTLYTTTFPCHNCAKHIIASGIERVVYVEPYPKSLAGELHDDAIDLKGKDLKRVRFQPFVGIGSRRYMDLFSMGLSFGYPVERKEDGKNIDWQAKEKKLRVPMLPTTYIEREETAFLEISKILENKNNAEKED